MNILITGSSGLIGTALKESLASSGHGIFTMTRNQTGNKPFSWQPGENKINLDNSTPIDAVIHLAGANIAKGRWTKKRKQTILESRENGTRLLSNTLAGLKNKPKVFLSGSAIGFYGDTGTNTADETSPAGSGFLADVCEKWENAAQPAAAAGIRTVNMRIGVVLSPRGGMLKKLLLPFKLGLGGKTGNGKQFMSWAGIGEITNMIAFLLENDSVSGPVNLVSPTPTTNRTFTKTLGRVLKRPAIFPFPAFAARMVFGEMADALMLSGSRVVPKKLEEAGYRFSGKDLESTLRSLLDK